jgi:hypothetical protein
METRNELLDNFSQVLESLNMKATAEIFKKEFNRKIKIFNKISYRNK